MFDTTKTVITNNLSIYLCFVSMLSSKKTKSTYYGCSLVPLLDECMLIFITSALQLMWKIMCFS